MFRLPIRSVTFIRPNIAQRMSGNTIATRGAFSTSAAKRESNPTTQPKATAQKNIKDWEVLQLDPRGGTPCFANSHLSPEYASYNPPHGYTAEEIMEFQGANEVFASVKEIEELISLRDKYGTLDVKVGDA
ncbi:hypothetical protein H0H87_007031 [Tephrocybe sp. NHM501043]|nr:hypothetical protein H0H87_007031 [Tephrocybe sp. NHM501043]